MQNSPDIEEHLHGTRDWPHAPPHRLNNAGVYFVTSRTLNRTLHFKSPARRSFLRGRLLVLAQHYGWKLEAWAVMANHYHFVAHSPEEDRSALKLGKWLRHLHGDVTRQINREDGIQGRTLWHNYRETHLTLQSSYYARLNYTHNNAVHHKLTGRARDYEWCSAYTFEETCTPAWVNTIYSFKFDQVAADDEDNAELG